MGIFRPLEMLPLMVPELVWKAVWTIAFGIPLWRAGRLTGEFAETMLNCIFGVVFVLAVTPRGCIRRTFFSKPAP